ncbi:MAG: NAD(+) diphosphatase [Lachnospirales bacterium]
MKFEFCPKCGNSLIKKEIGDEGFVPYCEKCERPFFDIPSPCVIIAAINEYDEVCLIRQSYGKDRYVCIAGYIKIGESSESCVLREVEEEIGITPYDIKFIKTYPMEKAELLMIGYMVRVKKGEFKISTELKEAKWFKKDEALKALEGANIAYMLVEESYGRL